ncbi:Mitochondrial ATPase complex subunit atp10 [Puccinia graminis f. sp. tritici]|uniref:Mitochondrial ATPase complex subunit atp10 n=1 Tax=Puccinia graminis f. sp. tritici TaxID=56615 RepID=A0A5B0SKM2_PUCGR|nr:Mitochondrial ATPase complex subunit atp10 [Puccinia graminis f. sp. tritici]
MLPSPSRSTVRQLTTQQLLRRPPSTFSCRRSPRWYSSRPDPSRTDSNVDQAKPVNLPAATSSSPEASQAPSTTETERPKPPPYLPRPLGVEDPPSTRPPTEEEKLAKLVDEQARLQERKHLISEVSRGYYHDWNQLRHNGNKLWTAPPSLIQDQRALYFPNISGVALSNKETKHTTDIFADKVSILAVESTRMSEEHTRSFYGEPLRMLAEEDNLQLVRLNVQENPLKSWLVSLFINNLRKTVPPKQHQGYILTNQSLEYVREPLGMVNKLLGYVYLVDWNKKIRWAGCGFSNAEEVSALFCGTRTLLKRFEENKKQSSV